MSQVTGAITRILKWAETTFNTTPGTPVAKLMAVQSFGLKFDEARDADPTLSGYRGAARAVAGRQNVGGSIVVTPAPESIGSWLRDLIGVPTTTGVGPYTHTFTPNASGANALPAGSGFEVDYSSRITGAGRFLVYNGTRCASGTFNFPTQGVPTLTLEYLGASMDSDNVATLDASPEVSGHTGWGVKNIALSFDAGALSICLESLSFTISNDLDDSAFCIANGAQRHALAEGQFLLTGALVAFFDTAALMNKALADTDLAAVITLSRGNGLGSAANESLVFTIPVAVVAPTTPPVDGPKGLKLSTTFSAHRESGEIGFTAVLKNAIASIL